MTAHDVQSEGFCAVIVYGCVLSRVRFADRAYSERKR